MEKTNWFRDFALQYISENDFKKIDNASVNLRFKKGEVILKQGGKPIHIAFLQKGIVKFNYENKNNKNTIIAIVAGPGMLSEANIFYDQNFYSVIAIEECDVTLIDSTILLGLLADNGKFTVAFYRNASAMAEKSLSNFISLANNQVEGRIADIIMYLSENIYHSDSFQLSLSRKELAEFACCSTENIIMTLSKWQLENILKITGKHIAIRDVGKLKHISKIG